MQFIRKQLLKSTLALGFATGLVANPYLFAGVFVLSHMQMAAAETEKPKASTSKVAGEFDNMCVMGLADGKRIKTDCAVNTVFEDKTYCFRTEDAKVEFNKDPKRNLERAKDHFAAGEVAQTGDDMGKYSVDDVKTWIDQHIQNESKKNNGIYFVHDSLTGEKLPLKYTNIDFMRTLHGYGFFPEAVFTAEDDPNKKYLIDFWVKPKKGKLDLFDVRIYKSPRKDGANWTLVKRQPKPWWWIPASEHPGESEQNAVGK
jgi:YHS domain-containing protein